MKKEKDLKKYSHGKHIWKNKIRITHFKRRGLKVLSPNDIFLFFLD